MGKPMLEAQESPPFEKPSIEQVIDHTAAQICVFSSSDTLTFSLSQTGSEQFCPVQIQPPAFEGASDHHGAGQDVPEPDQLLAAGDALPAAPEGPQR